MDGSLQGKKTILVADDHASVLMMVAMVLTSRGYHVVTLGIGDKEHFPKADMVLSHAQLTAGDLPHALIERIKSCDAIVTDYQYTHGLTGVDFIEQVRNIAGCDAKPVIVHSSNPKELLNDDMQMQRATNVGITRDHVFNKDEGIKLAAHVTQLLASAPAQQR